MREKPVRMSAQWSFVCLFVGSFNCQFKPDSGQTVRWKMHLSPFYLTIKALFMRSELSIQPSKWTFWMHFSKSFLPALASDGEHLNWMTHRIHAGNQLNPHITVCSFTGQYTVRQMLTAQQWRCEHIYDHVTEAENVLRTKRNSQ